MTAPTFLTKPPSVTGRHVQGVPETLADAQAMTTAERIEAIRKLFLHIEDIPDADFANVPRNADGEVFFDSLLGLDLFTEMTAHLGEKPLDLSTFSHDMFETFAGVEEVVRRAHEALAKKV